MSEPSAPTLRAMATRVIEEGKTCDWCEEWVPR